MSGLTINDKDVVVPGEVLAEGMDYLPSHGTYRLDDTIRAGKLGLARIDGKVIKIIPLSGVYSPRRNDVIICKVFDVLMSGWRVNTFTPYSAMLSMKDGTNEFIMKGANLTKYHKIGDYIMCKVVNVTSQRLIDVTMKGPGLRKLDNGRFIRVNSHKVPRIIGKQGSMVSMVKNATGCRILVGQNGVVWVSGEPEMEILAIETIKKVEKESHVSGLTDAIKVFLEEKTGKKLETKAEEKSEPEGEQQ